MSIFNEEPSKPKVLPLLLVGAVVIACVAFFIPFAVTGDAGWFLSGPSAQPSELIIWQQGQSISIKPGDPGFDTINTQLQKALSNITQYSDFGPSDETLTATRNSLALEVLYDKPITIHSSNNLGSPQRLMFPLSGQYFTERRFYLGQVDKYRAGGPQVSDTQPLHDAVTSVLASRNALLPTQTPAIAGADTTSTAEPPTVEPPTAGATVAAPGVTATSVTSDQATALATSASAASATPMPATAPPATAVAASTAQPTSAEPGMDGSVAPADTFARLQANQIPARDLYTLNQQIKVKSTAPVATPTPMVTHIYKVGDKTSFWMGDITNNSYYTTTADLVSVSDHAYWWVQSDYDVDRSAISSVAQTFEKEIYPTNRANFGPEPGPGIENDPRITVLFAPISGAGGYFSSADLYPSSINPYSNERKMIYIASDPNSSYSLGTIAHEFQHMIHFNRHMHQDVWINEGMSELAMKLNGYDPGSTGAIFLNNPDVQLNQWAATPDQSLAHYGAAYTFTDYFYQQYGGAKAMDALMNAPGVSIDSIDNALKLLGSSDSFNDLFTNFTLANWLNPDKIGGRYEYPDGSDISVPATKSFNTTTVNYNGTVHEQAADYIEIAPSQGLSNAKVNFSGASLVQVLSGKPHSGAAMWWSDRGDLSSTTLTRNFDLSKASGKLTLSYWLWYDIEKDYDYGYAEISSDGGKTWDTLPGKYTSDTNPSGTNLGHGYTGLSGGGNAAAWVQDQVDLSAYAGKQVQIRFQYITDDGYNSQGLALDDIQIPEIGYSDDVEAGASGWQAAGFARIGAAIPQGYAVNVITYPQSGAPTVNAMQLDDQNKGSYIVPATSNAARIVVVVTALAPYTIQTTNYSVNMVAP